MSMGDTSESYLCDLYTGKPHWNIVSYLWKPVGQHLSQHSGECVLAAHCDSGSGCVRHALSGESQALLFTSQHLVL